MRKLTDLIAPIFLLLLILTLLSGLSMLLGFKSPEETTGHHNIKEYAYNNWIAVLVSIGLFTLFITSFITPVKKYEWRSLGMYEAFIIALFTEMYGFPLTIYTLTSLFNVELSFGHMQGHLLAVLLSETGVMSLEQAWALVMTASTALIFLGLFLISKGWHRIHRATGELVTDGIYRHIRHPQYLGIILITIGLLIQWPTIITLVMWPFLMVMYYRLARREEKEALETFGQRYEDYKRQVPMFLPALRKTPYQEQYRM